MRARLMTAAVACLTEHGYAGFSTNDVVRRANVTRGALFHHFPTRAQLIAEAVWWHSKAKWIKERAEMLAEIDAGASLLDQLRLSWRFFKERGATDIEFRTATRADADLAAAWQAAVARNEHVEPRYNTVPVAWATAPGDPSPELSRFMVGFFLTGLQSLASLNAPELPEQALEKFAQFLEAGFANMDASKAPDMRD